MEKKLVMIKHFLLNFLFYQYFVATKKYSDDLSYFGSV